MLVVSSCCCCKLVDGRRGKRGRGEDDLVWCECGLVRILVPYIGTCVGTQSSKECDNMMHLSRCDAYPPPSLYTHHIQTSISTIPLPKQPRKSRHCIKTRKNHLLFSPSSHSCHTTPCPCTTIIPHRHISPVCQIPT